MGEHQAPLQYKPSHIANYFLDKAIKDDYMLTPMKLIKLVYLAYGWSLSANEKLFDEPIEAWRHGPVIPSLYHEFKKFGSDFITGHAVEFNIDADEDDLDIKPRVPRISEDDNYSYNYSYLYSVLNFVWDAYNDFTAWELRDLTHKDDAPWRQTVGTDGPTFFENKVIKDNIIKEYFEGQYEKYFGKPINATL